MPGKLAPGLPDFRSQVGRAFESNVARFFGSGLVGPWGLESSGFGVPAVRKLCPGFSVYGIQCLHELGFQCGRKIGSRLSGLLASDLPAFGPRVYHRLYFGFWLFGVRLRIRATPWCSGPPMMAGVHVGPQTQQARSSHGIFTSRQASFGHGASGSTRKPGQMAKPRCS